MQALNQLGSELAPDCALCTTDANSRGHSWIHVQGAFGFKMVFLISHQQETNSVFPNCCKNCWKQMSGRHISRPMATYCTSQNIPRSDGRERENQRGNWAASAWSNLYQIGHMVSASILRASNDASRIRRMFCINLHIRLYVIDYQYVPPWWLYNSECPQGNSSKPEKRQKSPGNSSATGDDCSSRLCRLGALHKLNPNLLMKDLS